MENKIEIETFRKIGSYQIGNLKQETPSSLNSVISIKKYKISVEEIEEPIEVYEERIQYLWDKCDNYHHIDAIRTEAKTLGYTLKGSYGSKR